jgi:pimeloyl-ACP methyl ester carboxylesterase
VSPPSRDAHGHASPGRVQLRDGVRLHVLRWPGEPDAIPFLLVHGLASNAELWRGVADLLAEDGHAVVAVDLRAHGRSDPDDHLDHATLSADLVEVAAACGLDRPVVVGQSWGGNLAVELAARHPRAVRSVVGVDGGHLELADRFATADEAWDVLAPPDWDATPVTWDEVVARVTAATPRWSASARAAQLANLAVTADGRVRAILTRDRHRAILGHLHAHRPSQEVPQLTVPVLLTPVDGSGDGSARARVGGLVDSCAHVHAHWFGDRDHDVHAQAPDEVAAVLRDHAAHLREGTR